MTIEDTCVTIQPYFVAKEGAMGNVKPYLEKLVAKSKSEKDCLYYGFTICGDKFHCREGYVDADGALAHFENVGALLQEMLGSGIADLTDLQIHGPENELAKLRAPLADLNPNYWVLEYGFRK